MLPLNGLNSGKAKKLSSCDKGYSFPGEWGVHSSQAARQRIDLFYSVSEWHASYLPWLTVLISTVLGITNGWDIHEARLSFALNRVFTSVDLPKPDAPKTQIFSKDTRVRSKNQTYKLRARALGQIQFDNNSILSK